MIEATALKTKFDLDLEIQVEAKWVVDETADLSFLGEYTSQFEEGCIDRVERGDHRGHEYRYWMPSSNHYPHKPKNWSHVRGKARKEVIKKYGSIQKADEAYVLADYKRSEDYNNDLWHMTGCIVTVRFGSLFAKDSLWGIESDCGGKYREEVEAGCLSAAIHELKDKMVKRLQVE